MVEFRPGEINIVCTSLDASLRFYVETLSFEEGEHEDEAVRLHCGKQSFLLLPFARQARPQLPYILSPEFSFDLMVDDLKAASDHLEEHSVYFEEAYREGADSFIIRDPDGMIIEVIEAS